MTDIDEQKQVLDAVEADLTRIKKKLAELSEKYRNGGEYRIAFEVLQSIRALDEAIYIAGVYLRGTDGLENLPPETMMDLENKPKDNQ